MKEEKKEEQVTFMVAGEKPFEKAEVVKFRWMVRAFVKGFKLIHVTRCNEIRILYMIKCLFCLIIFGVSVCVL